MIIGIVAIAKNLAIGRNGKLPWHYPADLRFFKEMTTGNAIVMGSNTWRAIGRPLPNRLNIVLSRGERINEPGIMQLESVEEVLDLAKYLNRDVYVIGGAKTYEAFTEQIEAWLVTSIPVEIADADAFMPAGFLDGFAVDAELDLGDGLVVRTFRRDES